MRKRWLGGELAAYRAIESNRLCVVPPNQESGHWSIFAEFDGEFGYDKEIGTGATLMEALGMALAVIEDTEEAAGLGASATAGTKWRPLTRCPMPDRENLPPLKPCRYCGSADGLFWGGPHRNWENCISALRVRIEALEKAGEDTRAGECGGLTSG